MAVRVDALRLLDPGLARESHHEIAARVHIPVLCRDRGMTDPVLQPPQTLVVPLLDLALHARQWFGGEAVRLVGRGAGRSHGLASYEAARRRARGAMTLRSRPTRRRSRSASR